LSFSPLAVHIDLTSISHSPTPCLRPIDIEVFEGGGRRRILSKGHVAIMDQPLIEINSTVQSLYAMDTVNE